MSGGDTTSSGLDAIARDLASGQISRRTALKRFAGLSLGAMLPGALFADSALAKCPQSRRCSGKCCPIHAHCQHGKCKCLKGFTKCDKSCRNLDTDVKNCGACGHKCPDGKTCVNGHCKPGQPQQVCGNEVREGTEACDGADLGGEDCVSLGFSGGALACAGDCTFDTTGCASCDPGYSYCSGTCIDTTHDANNCGACGHVCPDVPPGGTRNCSVGTCHPNCPIGYSACGEMCCAACTLDQDCPSGFYCADGSPPRLCAQKKGAGTACQLGHECTSGMCVGNVCTA